MKRVCSLVSFIMLVTLAFIQLVQAVHQHHDAVHFTRHTESSSHEDLQLADAKCFLCSFHSNTNTNPALLPSVLTISTYMVRHVLQQAELSTTIRKAYTGTSYNKGPPSVPLFSL
ncbi:MAG: hypothetical protein ACO1NU_01270 [Arcticibacter sp.]